MHLRKGDTVVVITGKEKGKTGKVLKIEPDKQRIWVERINMVKRHQKPTQTQKQGGIVEKESPLNISNVMLYDEKAGKGTRVSIKVLEDGKKARVSRRTGEMIGAAG
jgi:large subunit ribosomal protein L24